MHAGALSPNPLGFSSPNLMLPWPLAAAAGGGGFGTPGEVAC